MRVDRWISFGVALFLLVGISGCSDEASSSKIIDVGTLISWYRGNPSEIEKIPYRMPSFSSKQNDFIKPTKIDLDDLVLAVNSGSAVGKNVVIEVTHCSLQDRGKRVYCTRFDRTKFVEFVGNDKAKSELIHLEENQWALLVGQIMESRYSMTGGVVIQIE